MGARAHSVRSDERHLYRPGRDRHDVGRRHDHFAQRIEEGVRASVIEGSGAAGRTTEGRLLMAQGRYTEAAQLLEQVVADSPETPLAWDHSLEVLRDPG